MEIRVLRYFLAVAREENITRAAKTLRIAQPSLSKQLMELERELGKQLLIRGKRKISLTEEGMLLRQRAEEIVALVQKTEREVSADFSAVSGEVAIGGGETQSISLVAEAAAQLSQQFPDIQYHLFCGDASEAAELLEHGMLDFGLMIQPVNILKYDSLPLPVCDTWGVLLPKAHPLAKKRSICPEHLRSAPLILPKRSALQREFSLWLGEELPNLHLVATYNVVHNAALLVKKGLGIAFSLQGLVPEDGLCFRPLSPKIEARLSLIWKRYQVFSPAAEKFLQAMRSVAAEKSPQQS